MLWLEGDNIEKDTGIGHLLFELLCLSDAAFYSPYFCLAKLLRHHRLSHWRERVLAHLVTTPVAITVSRAAMRDLQSPEKDRVQVVTTPAVITVWLRQTAAKQPSIDLVLARVALIPAVTTAFRASEFY